MGVHVGAIMCTSKVITVRISGIPSANFTSKALVMKGSTHERSEIMPNHLNQFQQHNIEHTEHDILYGTIFKILERIIHTTKTCYKAS